MLEEYRLNYISSVSIAVGRRTSLLKDSNLLLTAMSGDSGTETMNADFSKGDILAELNGLYTNIGIRDMHETKTFDHLDSVLPFLAAIVDRAMGKRHRHPMTNVLTNFSERGHLLSRNNMKHVQTLHFLNTMQQRI